MSGLGATTAIDEASEAKIDWRRVFRTIKPDRARLVLLGVIITLASVLGVVPALLTQAIIDKGVLARRPATVALLGSLALLTALTSSSLKYVQQWLATLVSQAQLSRLRTALFAKMQKLPWSYFVANPTGATLSRLTTDPAEAQNLTAGVIPQLISVVTAFASVAVAMTAISWEITVLALVLGPALLVPATVVGHRLRRLSHGRMRSMGTLMTVIEERASAPGAMLSRLYTSPTAELRRFERENEENRRIGMDIFKASAIYGTVTGLLGAVAAVLVYWIGGLQAIHGDISVGDIVAMAALVTGLYAPIESLSSLRLDVLSASASFQRIFSFLDLAEEGADRQVAPASRFSTSNSVGTVGLSVELSGVGVDAQSEDRLARLTNVSLALRPGERVALVGPSGAGKSTLLHVLAGLVDVDAGRVLLGGVPLDQVSRDELRSAVGLLAQDSHFFHDSVRENLQLCRPTMKESEIEAACLTANVWHVVQSLDDGLDTSMGDHGGRLSGGERQRLAMARLLLLDPRLVLLDEPTAHLDQASEQVFLAAMRPAFSGRTLIMATHRLASIQDFDKILVLEGGEVVEVGTHEDLLAAGGWYADRHVQETFDALVPQAVRN